MIDPLHVQSKKVKIKKGWKCKKEKKRKKEMCPAF